VFNKYFEEYQIGDTWRSRGRTITESDLVMFAAWSGDWYPLHTDQEWAKNTQFGQRIAHGLLILSASMGLTHLEPGRVVAFYGIDHLRFVRPTYIGDTIHVEMEVASKQDKGEAGIVASHATVLNQDGNPVLVTTHKLLIAKRPAT
jgi:3-hydroxybutyryl-CoA dehydratase